MTPSPDTATPETTVLDALKLMNGKHMHILQLEVSYKPLFM
jgi:CBS domain-containing protein